MDQKWSNSKELKNDANALTADEALQVLWGFAVYNVCAEDWQRELWNLVFGKWDESTLGSLCVRLSSDMHETLGTVGDRCASEHGNECSRQEAVDTMDTDLNETLTPIGACAAKRSSKQETALAGQIASDVVKKTGQTMNHGCAREDYGTVDVIPARHDHAHVPARHDQGVISASYDNAYALLERGISGNRDILMPCGPVDMMRQVMVSWKNAGWQLRSHSERYLLYVFVLCVCMLICIYIYA
jgi:hypothetical protein